jgi:hypothetical protein
MIFQKYWLNLKRVANPPRDLYGRHNFSSYVMNHRGSPDYYYGHQIGHPSSEFSYGGSEPLFTAPSVIVAHGVSIQSKN